MSRFDEAFDEIEAHLSLIPGAVLGLVENGTRQVRATGFAQISPIARPMLEDTVFDLASLTKVIFTTPAILQLASEGRLDLDAPIASVIPDLRQYDVKAWERKITFRQALGHQSLLPAVEPIYTYGDDPLRLRAFVLQREWRKGKMPVYSDINFILLGIAIERLTGMTLRELAPGGSFAWSAHPDLAAATEYCTLRDRVLCGEVHDENAWALQGAGHAGLFGTIDCVLDFASDLLARPEDPAVALMREPLSATRTHGWERPYEGWSGGPNTSEHTIGHTGFTGTGLWIDFERGRAWSLLTNRVHPSRHKETGIAALRQKVGAILNKE